MATKKYTPKQIEELRKIKAFLISESFFNKQRAEKMHEEWEASKKAYEEDGETIEDYINDNRDNQDYKESFEVDGQDEDWDEGEEKEFSFEDVLAITMQAMTKGVEFDERERLYTYHQKWAKKLRRKLDADKIKTLAKLQKELKAQEEFNRS